MVSGQPCNQPFLGSKTLYQPLQETYTSPPKGYTPVFINHVGRHGSRHLTKNVSSYFAFNLLNKAEQLAGLSDDGKSLRKRLTILETIEKNDIGSISVEGSREQFQIATRMFENFTNVFNSITPPTLNLMVTSKIRTVQTKDAFIAGLKNKISQLKVNTNVNDTVLRFYDLSPAYIEYKENGNWTALLDKMKRENNYATLAKQFTQQFFTRDFILTLAEKDYDNFISNIFSFASIIPSIQDEIKNQGFTENQVNVVSFFNCLQLIILGKLDDAEDYLVKGPGINNEGIQIKIAVPLLADFINQTDYYIKEKSFNAQLRFTHAEAIAPFAAIMNIVGADESTLKTESFPEIWNASKIVPLSANVQWVLYQKRNSRKYLIKFLLNEREVQINGLKTKTFPYYKWKKTKSFYLKKIKKLDWDKEKNSFENLQNLN